MKEYQVTVDFSGTTRWRVNNKLHRDDGPAVEYINSGKEWWINGIRHRDDGPAIEYDNGDLYWYQNGELHREDGPAMVDADGTKEWYLHGVEYTEAEFLAKTQPAKELTMAEIEKLLGHRVKVVK